MSSKLTIKNLKVAVENKTILHGVDLIIKSGEFHVIMGPNGSGKSTLTYALMGHPAYAVNGITKLGAKDILKLKPELRARAGLMLAFQNPISVTGVTLSNFLRTSYREMYGSSLSLLKLHDLVRAQAQELNLHPDFLQRYVNDGLSGGEKKKSEMLQLIVLKPKFAILDEIDTGLDVDALKTVASGVDRLQSQNCGILMITHYQRILKYLKPQFVHVMIEGRIVVSGGAEIITHIENKGYAKFHRT